MKKIRTFGDKVLRVKCKEVTTIDESVRKCVSQLQESLLFSKGVGLAAPQIGIRKRIFVARVPETEKIITLINPRIVKKSGKIIDLEGCLSFPEIFFSIERASEVAISGWDEKERCFNLEASGLLARCFQHECDHLDGVLIIDYASTQEKNFWKEKLEKLKQKSKS